MTHKQSTKYQCILWAVLSFMYQNIMSVLRRHIKCVTEKWKKEDYWGITSVFYRYCRCPSLFLVVHAKNGVLLCIQFIYMGYRHVKSFHFIHKFKLLWFNVWSIYCERKKYFNVCNIHRHRPTHQREWMGEKVME